MGRILAGMRRYVFKTEVKLRYTGPPQELSRSLDIVGHELAALGLGTLSAGRDGDSVTVAIDPAAAAGSREDASGQARLGIAMQRLEAALAGHPFEVIAQPGAARPPELPLYVALNAGCNLKCWYCTEHGENRSFEKPQLTTARLMELLDAAYAVGYRTFRFTGGEPTNRPDVAEILAATQALGDDVQVAITTNGARLERLFPVLGDLREPKIFLSVDGLALGGAPPRGEKVFAIEKWLTDDLLEQVDQLLQEAYVRFNFVLTKASEKQFWPLLAVARRLGIDIKVFELLLRDFYFVNGRPRDEVFRRQYVSVRRLADELKSEFGASKRFAGLGGRGIPMRSVSTGSNRVIYFGSDVGSHYTPTVCGNCEDREWCQEGLYAPLLNASGSLHPAGCTNTKNYRSLTVASASDVEDILRDARRLIHMSRLEPPLRSGLGALLGGA